MAAKPPGSPSQQIVEVARLHRNLAASLLAEIGLHPGQDKILKLLVECDGRTMSELAAALAVQAPTVTKTVGRLTAGGLLIRQPGPNDARQTRVFLTEMGRERAARIDRVWKKLDKRTLAGIDKKDRKRLAKLLKALRNNLASGAEPAATVSDPASDGA